MYSSEKKLTTDSNGKESMRSQLVADIVVSIQYVNRRHSGTTKSIAIRQCRNSACGRSTSCPVSSAGHSAIVIKREAIKHLGARARAVKSEY